MGLRDESLELHRLNRGKLASVSKVKVETAWDLSLTYNPGVAEPCKEIARDRELVYELTNRGNLVAVISDGTAVLGLGDIGPEAAMPVMEGKSVLLKEFAAIDSFPICLASKDVDELVQAIQLMEPSFGGINLEDISGPRCFAVEERLKATMNIPLFHDDQHGTAVVCCAGLLNALKVAGKNISEVKIVLIGAGAAGIAITKMLMAVGVQPTHIRVCDKGGWLYPGQPGINPYQEKIAQITNPDGVVGDAAQAFQGMDVFIGVSAANIVTPEMIGSMAPKPIVFSLASPVPEIMPDLALKAGAIIAGTARSDYPNQINNILGFPGIFRGALDVRATCINEAMKAAATHAIAALIPESELSTENIIPKALDRRVVPAVALAVAQAAIDSGVAKTPKTQAELREGFRKLGLL